MELSTRHFVRPEDLNHHETLYAGRISEWITEAAMIGVTRLLGSNEGVVLVALNNISIQKPTVAGAILDFYMEKGTPRSTSIPIYITVIHMLTGQVHAKGTAIFVTVDENGKKTPHHLS